MSSISIRLDPETERELRQRLQYEGASLSEFVRDAIREKLAKSEPELGPYELGESLFGRYASGDTDRSSRRKELIRSKSHEKYHNR